MACSGARAAARRARAGRPTAPPSRGWCGRRSSGRYAALGRGRLALLALGLAYLISPVDLVPEAVIPLLGLVDDGVVALWLAGAFLAETDNYLRWERSQPVIVEGDARPAAW